MFSSITHTPMITNLHQQFHLAMSASDDYSEMSMSNGSLSDVQEEGSAMNLLEIKKNLDKSDSNSMSVHSNRDLKEPKVPLLNLYPKKKNSSPIKDDMI